MITYGGLKQHVLLALGGQPSIVSGVTRDQRIAEIINQAGNYLFSKQWRFRERTSRPIGIVASRNWSALPDDVDDLVSLTCKAGLGWRVEMTTPEMMDVLRTATEPALIEGVYYACLARPWAQPDPSTGNDTTTPLVAGSGMPAVRLEFYPTPQSNSSDALIVRYRAGWVAVSGESTGGTPDTYIIPVPAYAEALLVAYARAFALAYEDEGLTARLIEIDSGPIYDTAAIKDGIQQRDYGRLPTNRVGPFRRESDAVSSRLCAVGGALAPASAFSNIRWRGSWSGVDTYAIGDVVKHDDKVWIAVVGSTNKEPPDPVWDLMVEAIGPAGPSGPTGPTGPAGPAGPTYTAGDHITIVSDVIDWQYDPFKRAIVESDMNALGNLTVANSGTGASTIFTTGFLSTDSTVGIATSQTGSTAAGRSFVGLASSDQLELGGGEVVVKCRLRTPSALSDSVQRYTLRMGILDTRTNGAVNDGLFFSYSDTINGGNWSVDAVAGGGAYSPVDTGLALAAATWYSLEIVVNAAATEAKFYIDGVLVHTETTTIPSGTSQATGAGYIIFKSVGTTATSLYVDYWGISKEVSR
jgi:hypothetical protein